MIIYTIGLKIFHFFIAVIALFNRKAKLFHEGRKQSFHKLLEFNKTVKTNDLIYWFHCASLGEFEQARPLIEALKRASPEAKIAISFFSPSGYEIRKNYELAEVVFYLPVAHKSNAQKVLGLLKPTKIFFIKYEFWIHYIEQSQAAGIPVYLVSALFRRTQIFFQWYGKLFLNLLPQYTKIFVQDKESQEVLADFNIQSVVSGDTRFDRVITNKLKASRNELVELFAGNKKLIVLGSSWQKEEELMFQVYEASLNYKIIIAPHDIHRNVEIPAALKSISYSQAVKETINDYEVLIIDNIGMLASLYSYAGVALVGGGFRGSLHNILEAAVFGIPVLYGHETQKHPEAEALQAAGGGLIFSGAQELKTALQNIFSNEIQRQQMGEKAFQFIMQNAGATAKIASEI